MPMQAHATLHTYYEPCGPATFDITAPQEEVSAPHCQLPDDSKVSTRPACLPADNSTARCWQGPIPCAGRSCVRCTVC
jgi:hypothetical protein